MCIYTYLSKTFTGINSQKLNFWTKEYAYLIFDILYIAKLPSWKAGPIYPLSVCECPLSQPLPNWRAFHDGKNRGLSAFLPWTLPKRMMWTKWEEYAVDRWRYFGHCKVLSEAHHFPLRANVIDKSLSFFSTSPRK